MGLDFWGCLEGIQLYYNRRNTVILNEEEQVQCVCTCIELIFVSSLQPPEKVLTSGIYILPLERLAALCIIYKWQRHVFLLDGWMDILEKFSFSNFGENNILW